MSKYSIDEKLKAVKEVKERHMRAGSVAKQLGTAKAVVQRWVALYEIHGEKGLTMKRGSYSGEFKVNVIKYMNDNHLSLFQTAVKFGIPSDATVGKWERIYNEEGPEGLYRDNRGRKGKMKSDKTSKKALEKESEEGLIAEVQRLRMENEYLKKLQALVQERIDREAGKKPPSSMN